MKGVRVDMSQDTSNKLPQASPNQAPTKLLEAELTEILKEVAWMWEPKKRDYLPVSCKQDVQALLNLYAQWLESLMDKLPERKKLNVPMYGGPLIFDDDHDVKVGHNRCLKEVRAALSAEIDKLRGKQ